MLWTREDQKKKSKKNENEREEVKGGREN